MEKREQLYEGKAKKVFATDDADLVIVDYKDDATAGDGAKKGTIRGKGVVNNRLSNNLMKMLAEKGVPTHFVEELSDRETLVKKVEIVPLEVIIRNVAAGSFTKRLGVPEGTVLKIPTIEFSYKNDEYHDPLINHYHALALGLATQEEIDTITKYAFQVNDILSQYLLGFNIRLIDFKLEFGRLPDGSIVLADEINRSPAKVQSALLEAMQERQVTIGDNTYPLPQPFLVLATQNPLEQEGTYPLPEAQVDRFMLKARISYPKKQEERDIVRMNLSGAGMPQVNKVITPEDIVKARRVVEDVYMDEKIEKYIVDIIFATREPAEYNLQKLQNLIAYGGSPRASISLGRWKYPQR